MSEEFSGSLGTGFILGQILCQGKNTHTQKKLVSGRDPQKLCRSVRPE